MSDDLRELSALAALGALSPADMEHLTEAAADDGELAREVALDRAAIEQFARIADPGIAPPDLADRLVAAATAAPVAQPAARADVPAVTAPPRRRLRRWAPAFGGGLATAVAAVAVTLIATRGSEPERPAVQASIVAAADVKLPISGKVALYRPTAPGGHVVVDLASLPPAPAGHHYEVWVLKKNATTMEPVGTIAPDAATPVHLDLPLPSGGTYGALDISIEENGGPPEHSGKSIAGATFGV